MKFGLETTAALLAAVGNPHRLVPVLHVGGTNGKGSVAALAASALRAAGWRTGLYTSPHLVSFRERIRVDGAPISEAAVAMWTERLAPLVRERDATFFEATTAIAFADFAARGAEVAVVEVGLGGRLDSTNVVTPAASAVTRIARDHEQWLGGSLEAIAREKAGIAKPGVPFVIGETDPAIVDVLAAAGRAAGADVRIVEPELRWDGELGLVGQHQRRNAAVAAELLAALPDRWRPAAGSVAAGFAAASLPGRFDRRGGWLFDVAHNPDGIATLLGELARSSRPQPDAALIGILADKDWPAMLELLLPALPYAVLTVPDSAGSRAWDPDAVRGWLAAAGDAASGWRVTESFAAALASVRPAGGTTLVTGSFHTVGDAMAHLGLADVDA